MEKLRAAICDDDPACVASVEAMLQRMAQEKGASIECFRFEDGADLLERYPAALDMLFLDVQMPFLSGMEAARQIRQRDTRVLIVFMSNYAQYAIQGYEVGAWRYLLKPLHWDRFERELRLPFERCLRRQSDFLCVKGRDGAYSLPCGELLYASTNRRKNVELHLPGQCIECYQSLSALETQLAGQAFFRCHSGFLVNLAQVQQIGRDFLALRDGSHIPVSKHRRSALMQAFAAYAGDML